MTKHRGTYVPRPVRLVYTPGLDGPIIAMVVAMCLVTVGALIANAL